MISTVRQISMSDAIDLVILRYLRAGDTARVASTDEVTAQRLKRH
jgi:hypothetical protein